MTTTSFAGGLDWVRGLLEDNLSNPLSAFPGINGRLSIGSTGIDIVNEGGRRAYSMRVRVTATIQNARDDNALLNMAEAVVSGVKDQTQEDDEALPAYRAEPPFNVLPLPVDGADASVDVTFTVDWEAP